MVLYVVLDYPGILQLHFLTTNFRFIIGTSNCGGIFFNIYVDFAFRRETSFYKLNFDSFRFGEGYFCFLIFEIGPELSNYSKRSEKRDEIISNWDHSLYED